MKQGLKTGLKPLTWLTGFFASSQAWSHDTDYHHVHFYDSFIQHLPLLGLVVAVLVLGYWLQKRGR